MAELRSSGSNGNLQQRFGGTEFFLSILMSLFSEGDWGVRRRRHVRRPRVRRPRMTRNNRMQRRRGGGVCGCGCFMIIILLLIPAIILFGGLVLFRAEITEFIYNWTGFPLPF